MSNSEKNDSNQNKKINDNVKELWDKVKKLDKRIMLIVAIILVIVLVIIFANISNKNVDNNYNGYGEEVVRHNLKVNIDFTENIIFSRYDVYISIADKKEKLLHGENKNLEFNIAEGEHTLYFTSADDSSIKKEISVNVLNNMEIGYKISCHNNEIRVEELYVDNDVELKENEIKMKNDKSEYLYKNYKDVIKELEGLGFTNIVEKPMYDIVIGWTEEGEVDNVTVNGSDTYRRGDIFKNDTEIVVSYHLKEEDDPSLKKDNETSENLINEGDNNSESNSNSESEEENYNYYTTNDNETAKNGNTGVYAYIKKGSNYDIYYIIDFEEKYVYYFLEGEENNWCDKLKIKSGDLNSTLLYTYHDGNSVWDEAMYFKYKNQPSILIMEDGNHIQHQLSTTSLKDALKLRDNKVITER